MASLLQTIRRPLAGVAEFGRQSRGNMIVSLALLLPIFGSSLGMAIDYGRASHLQNRLRAAADTSLIEASIAIEGGATVEQASRAANNTWNAAVSNLRDVTVSPSFKISSSGGLVSARVTYSGQMKTTFLQIVSIKTVPLSGAAAAQRAISSSTSACHSDAGGDNTGGASGVDFVLSNDETVTLPDMNGKTINVSGYGTVQFSHDANGATLVINSSCVNVTSLGHDFNGSSFIDNYVPPNMNFVSVAHSCNNCTFSSGSMGSGGVFQIGHDANGSSFTFITCVDCTSTSGDSTSSNGTLRLTE